jgi:hypothetical protein
VYLLLLTPIQADWTKMVDIIVPRNPNKRAYVQDTIITKRRNEHEVYKVNPALVYSMVGFTCL